MFQWSFRNFIVAGISSQLLQFYLCINVGIEIDRVQAALADGIDIIDHGQGEHPHGVLVQVGRLPPVPYLLAYLVYSVGTQAGSPGPSLLDDSRHIDPVGDSNSSINCY